MTIPANATEAPTIAKVWRQFKDNAPTFTTMWGLFFMTWIINGVINVMSYLLREGISGNPYPDTELIVGAVAAQIFFLFATPLTSILNSFAAVLMTAVPAIYYTTDRCPGPGEILGILMGRPLRYLMGGLLFAIASAVGFLLCIIPGILVVMTMPIYVHHVFTTDLGLITCLSKSFKAMFQDFSGYLGVSILCALAYFASFLLCILPTLVVWPMTQLYLMNYLHHKGLVRARELA